MFGFEPRIFVPDRSSPWYGYDRIIFFALLCLILSGIHAIFLVVYLIGYVKLSITLTFLYYSFILNKCLQLKNWLEENARNYSDYDWNAFNNNIDYWLEQFFSRTTFIMMDTLFYSVFTLFREFLKILPYYDNIFAFYVESWILLVIIIPYEKKRIKKLNKRKERCIRFMVKSYKDFKITY
jgi:hypothetical protein